MSYRSSVNLNRIEYDTILEEKDVDTLKVLEHQLIKNYIYISNTAAFSINNNNQYLFPDGEFSFKLGKSITPKYFKLELDDRYKAVQMDVDSYLSRLHKYDYV